MCAWVCVGVSVCVFKHVCERLRETEHPTSLAIFHHTTCFAQKKILKDTAASETPRQRNLMRKTHSSMTLEVLALVVAAVVVVAAVAATSVSIISDSLTLVNNLFLLNVRTTSVNLTIIEHKAGVKIRSSIFCLKRESNSFLSVSID